VIVQRWKNVVRPYFPLTFGVFSVVSLAVGIVFFAAHYIEVRSHHSVPLEVAFENTNLSTIWPAKGEARVLLVKNGVTVFSSSCDGLTDSVCKTGAMARGLYAKRIRAIELKKGKGIIRDGELELHKGTLISFENKQATRYIDEYPTKGYYPAYMAFSCFIGFAIPFFLLKSFREKLFR
jgi:hypothetical protein